MMTFTRQKNTPVELLIHCFAYQAFFSALVVSTGLKPQLLLESPGCWEMLDLEMFA